MVRLSHCARKPQSPLYCGDTTVAHDRREVGNTPEDINADRAPGLPPLDGVNTQVTTVELRLAPPVRLSRLDGLAGIDTILEMVGITPRTVRFNIAREVLADRIDVHSLVGFRLLIDIATCEGVAFARQIGAGVWGSYPDMPQLDIPAALSARTVDLLVAARSERNRYIGLDDVVDFGPDDDWDDDAGPTPPEEVMRHLRDVGPDKPMGYLPIRAITEFCGIPLADAIEDAQTHGLAWRVVGEPPASHVDSGALYVWDRNALGALLDLNQDILTIAEWPLDPDGFVEKVIDVTVHHWVFPALYELIGAAFSDDRFREPQRTKRPIRSA